MLTSWYSLINNMTNPLSGIVWISKNNHTTLFLCMLNLIEYILINCRTICFNCINIKKLFKFCCIVFTFNDDNFFDSHLKKLLTVIKLLLYYKLPILTNASNHHK